MEKVILLHGIFLPKYQLVPLAKFFTKNGYQVLNIGYPSTKYPLSELAKIVSKQLASEFNSSQKINLVTFSMGGLLIREIFSQIMPKNSGRMVMIAPPNHGSELADYFIKYKFARFLYGPALADLQTTEAVNRPSIDAKLIEFGVIAGSKAVDPIFGRFFSGAHDGKVAVARTVLAGQKDHLNLPFTHSLGPFNSQVQQQALHFLQNGCFRR